MQEPFGAFTWYPANDQPSDKAMYDVRISAPGDWVGVSNGRLAARRSVNGRTVTQWTNQDPMSSYLMTIAIGPYQRRHQTGPRGIPMDYWVPRGRPELVRPLLRTPAALRWLESKLGPYPFDRVGVVVTPSQSAMETQTMITFGAANFRYGSREVRRTMVHELAHHWYGDTVTPSDWRDVWMNEGMATYLEARWVVDQGWTTWRRWQREWRQDDQLWRDLYGPPGDYHRREFAELNVYYCSALMLDELRQKIGTATFNRLVRRWPQAHRNSNQSRASYVDWLEARTGRDDLHSFFRTWLMSKRSPVV
jgi:aminopeptidase N